MNGIRAWFGRTQYQGRHQRGNMAPPTYGRGRGIKHAAGYPTYEGRTRHQLAERRPSYGVPVTPRTHEVPSSYRAFGGQRRTGAIAVAGQPAGWFG